MTQNGAADDLKAATDKLLSVKRIYEDELLAKPNVVGVAIGYRQSGGKTTDSLSLVVLVSKKLPENSLNSEDQIPITLDGIPVDVQEVGEINII